MGQLQQLVLQLVVVFLCMTAAFTWYSVATINGGYSPTSVPMAGNIDKYYNDTYSFQSTLLNSTKSATTTPSTTDPLTGGSTLLAAAAQTLTLTFNSIGQMVDVINTAQTTLGAYGVPPYFFTFAILFVSVLMGMIIFAAVYKWWI
jgi:hypothetical protein